MLGYSGLLLISIIDYNRFYRLVVGALHMTVHQFNRTLPLLLSNKHIISTSLLKHFTQGGCYGVAMWLIGYSGWLLWCYYVVDKVLRVVAMVLLCGGQGTQGGCYGVAMWWTGYSGWLLWCYYVVDRVLRVVAMVLLCGW